MTPAPGTSPPPFSLTAQLQNNPLRTEPPRTPGLRGVGTRPSSLAPNRTGPISAPLIPPLGTPREWAPIPMPPPPNPAPSPTSAPSSPQISSASRWGTLTSQNRRLWAPDLRGCRRRDGCSALLPGGSAPGAGRRRSWVPSRAPGGPGHPPSAAAGGARALGGLQAGPAARGSLRKPWVRPGTARRRGSPGFMRPGTRRPAAQDDIKSPPPAARTSPRAGPGRGGRVGAFPGRLGDVVPAPLKGGRRPKGSLWASGREAAAARGWGPRGAELLGAARELHAEGGGLRSWHREAGAKGSALAARARCCARPKELACANHSTPGRPTPVPEWLGHPLGNRHRAG